MTDRDEIARMAREAGWAVHTYNAEIVERFFKLAYEAGAAAERDRALEIVSDMKEELQAKFEQTYMEGVIAGAAAEREACAKVCEGMEEPNLQLRYEYRRAVLNCADAIRARGHAQVADRLARHGIPMPGDDNGRDPV